MYKKSKMGKQIISLFAIGIFFTICLMPSLQGDSDSQYYDKPEKQKSIYLQRCYFFIYGGINDKWFEETSKYKFLWIHAEAVHVIGFGVSYDGPYTITQWIYDDDVKLTWDGENPKFRGLVTNNFIIGMQKARYL